MDLHKLLQRQLQKFNLDINHLPSNLSSWQELISRINQTYIESDQDRYLIERAMNISSHELQSLNEKLEDAQRVAGLGYWHTNKSTGKTVWSNQLRKMLGFDATLKAPELTDYFNMVHEDDRKTVQVKVMEAFNEGKYFDIEIRVKPADSTDYRWYQFKGGPYGEAMNNIFNEISGIALDITSRKKIENEVDELHNKVLISARRAGMSDVATAVLHNIGNILNSVNVSLGLLKENHNDTHMQKLIAVLKLIQENSKNLNYFFTQDDKGKHIPEYAIALITNFAKSYESINLELENLSKQIEHIRDITQLQSSLSGINKFMERVEICEMLSEAISICQYELNQKHISITKICPHKQIILTDKIKLIQILVNLIQNAKDALLTANVSSMTIVTEIKKVNEDFIEIRVIDNGIGIEKKNLTKIFSFGFTTKPEGHGFGLHGSALAAKEIGGKLAAESEGHGKGAEFILTLPIEG